MKNVLVLNGGSSSLKCWFHRVSGDPLPSDAPEPLWSAHVELQGQKAEVRIRKANGGEKSSSLSGVSAISAAIPPVLESLWSGNMKALQDRAEVELVGHRVVHGGRSFREPVVITSQVRAEIARQCEFAPVHNRLEMELIQEAEKLFGSGVRQMAVFDTAFHATIPPEAYVYAGPYEWLEKGIRRYGFHGISHQYASRRAAELIPSAHRMVICHLGSGCSLAAVHDGRCVDTTMGFTPLEGLVMATRSGSIDPSIVTYLVRHGGCSADDVDRILNRESGLKGIAGGSGDMREILADIEAGNPRAKLAFDVYAHRLCREVGAMAASLGGIDVLIFTGGVGENCPPLRDRVCSQLAYLGLRAGDGGNVVVIHAEEEWEIARECYLLEVRS